MDPNWLSALSLLGTCGSNGIRVRSHRLSSECTLHSSMCLGEKDWTFPVQWLTRSCQALRRHVYKVSPTLFFSPIQLSYKRQRHKEVNTLTTANSTAELTLPEEEDDYIIQIQTLSEGGLGPASDPIRIHQLSKLVPVVVNMWCQVESSGNDFSLFPWEEKKRWQKQCEWKKTMGFAVCVWISKICWWHHVVEKHGQQDLPLWLLFFLYISLSHSCNWSRLALLKRDRDILSSCWLTITRVPSHPRSAPNIFVEICNTIHLSHRGWLPPLLDAVMVLWDFRLRLSCSKCSFALLIFCAESLKAAAEGDRIPHFLFFSRFHVKKMPTPPAPPLRFIVYCKEKKMWVKNTLAG